MNTPSCACTRSIAAAIMPGEPVKMPSEENDVSAMSPAKPSPEASMSSIAAATPARNAAPAASESP
jgi:hypothetical protein